MAIEKVSQSQLPFVDGVPAVGQTRIDWIQNGEYTDGAVSATDNGGALNRASVKVQKNVDTINQELNKTKDSLSKVIDLAETHDRILNAQGDGTNLYDRVTAVEVVNKAQQDRLAKIETDEIEHVAGQEAINKRITDTVDPQITNIKKMLGNYKGFDQDGNPDINAPGLGVKGQVERNWENVVQHDNRIKSLESFWQGDTPDVLIRNTRDLRAEMGPSSEKTDKTIYQRVKESEDHVTTANKHLTDIDTAIGKIEFPAKYVTSTGTEVTAKDIWEYTKLVRGDVGANQNALNTAINDILLNKSDIKTMKEFDTSSGAKITNLESLVGLQPTDGMRGDIKALDLRESNNATRLEGMVKTVTDVVNLETTPAVRNLQEDMTKAKPDIYGTNVDTDTPIVKLGIKSTNKTMYEEMYLPFKSGSGFILDTSDQNVDSSFVRRYVDGKWEWKNLFSEDLVIGSNKSVRSFDGQRAVSFALRIDKPPVTVFGDDNTEIEIRGKITNEIDITGLKYKTSSVVHFTDTQDTFGKGQPVQFKVDGENALTVTYGGTVGTIVHSANIKNYVADIDPRTGFRLNRDTSVSAEVSIGNVNVIGTSFINKTVKLSDEGMTTQIEGEVSKIRMAIDAKYTGYSAGNILMNELGVSRYVANDYVEVGDSKASAALRTRGDDLKSVKVVAGTGNTLYTVWHDGLDAPKDDAMYARKNGVWTAFNPGGTGGGLADDAPDNGMPHVRVSTNGNAVWEALGSKDINLSPNIGIKFNTTDHGLVSAFSPLATGAISIGYDNSKSPITFKGRVQAFTLGNEQALMGLTTSDEVRTIVKVDFENDIMIGDENTAVYFGRQPFVDFNGSSHRVWHDGIDAPSDGSYYARNNGTWQKVFNGVDPTADVNTTGAFKSRGMNIGFTEQVGTDYIVQLGQSNQYTKLNGKVMDIMLAQPVDNGQTSIKGMLKGAELNVIAIKDNVAGNNHVIVGDASAEMRINCKEAYINGNTVITSAFDVPTDDKRYSRRNGKWIQSYYYGNFATNAPATPVEGDVFFEFVN
ncbi:Wac fibritin neck whiskers [Aeromonas phage Aeh1]|uniref:Wac fibritin neck whiskers n=1 Tax=Aeromonas phage Aeh1 TaxID=2880362 RepID=Q858C5_9CAUD|nr:fibritin neck whisker [Aeromonas phage Aeh1]AAP04359.2 Wac fibritin neck whiskers [Aeromonas phage Aeh1]